MKETRIETENGPIFVAWMGVNQIIISNHATEASGYQSQDNWEPYTFRGIPIAFRLDYDYKDGGWRQWGKPIIHNRNWSKEVSRKTQDTVAQRIWAVVQEWLNTPEAQENLHQNLLHHAREDIKILPTLIAQKEDEMSLLRREIQRMETDLSTAQTLVANYS